MPILNCESQLFGILLVGNHRGLTSLLLPCIECFAILLSNFVGIRGKMHVGNVVRLVFMVEVLLGGWVPSLNDLSSL